MDPLREVPLRVLTPVTWVRQDHLAQDRMIAMEEVVRAHSEAQVNKPTRRIHKVMGTTNKCPQWVATEDMAAVTNTGARAPSWKRQRNG